MRLETINDRLRDFYGIDTESALPMYRVVWANDQVEKMLTKYTDSGIEMLQPEVREVKKYPWMKDLYVLEYLTVVPAVNLRELAGKTISYEPLFPFKDRHDQPLPPNLEVCKLVIDGVRAAMGGESMAKYAVKDPDPNSPITSHEQYYEHKKAELDELTNAAFGEESGLKQAIVSGEGISVPSNYEVH